MQYLKILVFVFIVIAGTTSFANPNSTPAVGDKNRQDLRIAVVDLQLIVNNSTAITTIRKSVENIHQNLEKEFAEKELNLKKVDEELLLKRKTLNDEVLKKEIEEFESEIVAVQHDIQQKKSKLELAHNEAVAKVHKAVTNIVSNIAKRKNISLVLYSSQALFADKSLNISLEIIAELNQKLKFVPLNY